MRYKEFLLALKGSEDDKMKATSVQNIKNVKDISFSIENDPIERESELTIVATTDDDIFEINFEGSDLLQICKEAGFFTGWEKDQKIRELEKEKNKEINKLKQQLQQVEDDKERLTERYKLLNEEYQNLKDNGYRAMIHGKIYTIDEMVNMILELTALKTPTIENFADEEPSNRRDILRCAEKCVCGQREQDYGTPESNFQLIADLWNDYLGTKYRYVDDDKPINIAPLKPLDVSMMMALLKIARIRNGGGSGDSFVDLAGYAACGGEIWAEGKQKDLN